MSQETTKESEKQKVKVIEEKKIEEKVSKKKAENKIISN